MFSLLAMVTEVSYSKIERVCLRNASGRLGKVFSETVDVAQSGYLIAGWSASLGESDYLNTVTIVAD